MNLQDLSTINSKILAAQVVAYKLLGINKKLSLQCMQELHLRRTKGDDFDYESFIENQIESINLGLLNNNILQNQFSIFQKIINDTNTRNNT